MGSDIRLGRVIDDSVPCGTVFHVLVWLFGLSACKIAWKYCRNVMKKKTWLISVVIIVVIGIVGRVLFVSLKQMDRSQRITQDIDSLQSEADRIRQENETLSEKINYLSSDDFKEREARDKLGLKKPNEEVVAVKQEAESVSKDTASSIASPPKRSDSDVSLPPYRKWWNLFFGNIQ
jgi:cell division protein FtsB